MKNLKIILNDHFDNTFKGSAEPECRINVQRQRYVNSSSILDKFDTLVRFVSTFIIL